MMTRERAGRVRVHVVGIFLSMLCAGVCLPAAAQTAEAPDSAEATQTMVAPTPTPAPMPTLAALAEPHSFNIPAGSLADALSVFSEQSGVQLIYEPRVAQEQTVPALQATVTAGEALQTLLQASGLVWVHVNDKTIALKRPDGASAGDPSGIDPGEQKLADSYAGDDAVTAEEAASDAGTTSSVTTVPAQHGGIAEIIVTGQKREERIQDVPIAITALSMQDLTTSQVAGGPDLFTQVPNMTFTKTNFTGYSIQIRGIGTQAVSATTDPAVAVALNNSPFIRNRFFEQEFFDLDRVEILRGPQGTLYGRNATAGVVNLISAKPKFDQEGMASFDLGNYNSLRWEGMYNIPLIDDVLALRVAGAGTKRDGYATNEITDSPIDGRDLWSSRVSLRFKPNERFDANLLWEHFDENDDRIRSGKQLCKQDVVPFDSYSDGSGGGGGRGGVQAELSQGCKRNSLYAADSFEVPNGAALPYYVPLGGVGLPVPDLGAVLYAHQSQSRDLRVIESTVDPKYKAQSDIGELQLRFQLTDHLTLESESAYNSDQVSSLQDFNRFNTAPGAWKQPCVSNVIGCTSVSRIGVLQNGPNGGIFCDPQLGCSDRLVVVDMSTGESEQISQELRLSSHFDGAFNFSLGANYTHFNVEDKYYVFSNSFSLYSAGFPSNIYVPDLANAATYTPYVPGVTTNLEYMNSGGAYGDPNGVYSIQNWIYMDPNPIGKLNDQGHNYFLSRNPYRLTSYALFGETYLNITDALKLTTGLRWSVDEKSAPRIPSQLLVPQSVGYPVAEVINQSWHKPTGRIVLDWKPKLPFTDETLLYGSLSRGYKAGGANPPGYVRVYYSDASVAAGNTEKSLLRPKTFKAEYVNAFELGAKNTLFDGALTVNLAAFYYDYKDYQISEIVDRSAYNRNFDATIWGAELETSWWIEKNLRLGFKGGYTKTRIANGEEAIDLMDRTAGDPNWVVDKPFPTFSSNCIVPTYVQYDQGKPVRVGNVGGGGGSACEMAYGEGLDPVTGLPYVPNPTEQAFGANGTLAAHTNYPGFDPSTAPNGGDGIAKPLGGNELPNAPHYTLTLSGDYVIPMSVDWTTTLHTDLHWQSASWWRVFNDDAYDRLQGYFTMNIAAIIESDSGWSVMAYVKNVTDKTAITGAFLNSDDTGLTTNVFLTEPRLYGLRVTKRF